MSLASLPKKRRVSFFYVDILICALVHTDVSFMMFVVEMTTKFNQEMYAKLRARKNEPLSSIG